MIESTMLEKVRKLLALAEGAGTQAEADLASAQAEKIIAKYALDVAMLQEARSDRGKPTSRKITISNPYATAKSTLLNTIAINYDVKVIRISTGTNTVLHVFGFESDLEAVEILYASLTLQATSAMARETVPAFDSARAFRHAFLLGFAGTVGSRLKAAKREVVDSTPGSSLVLVSRAKEVDEAFRAEYPRMRTAKTSASSFSGRSRGQFHGGRADLGQSRFAGSRTAIG